MKTKTFSTVKKVSLSITMTEYERELLRRVCLAIGKGAEGVPLASIAGVCFRSGLTELVKEYKVEHPQAHHD